MSSTALIDALFMRTVDIVQSLPKAGPIQTSYEEKLALYSLYKQATEGDVNFTRPGMFDMLGRAKWDSWQKRKGLPSRDAKQLYVESMLAILRRFSDRPQAIALIEELESFSGDVEQQIMDGSFAQDDDEESEETPPRAPPKVKRSKSSDKRKADVRPKQTIDSRRQGKGAAARGAQAEEEEDDEGESESVSSSEEADDDDEEEDSDPLDDEDEEELDEAETYRRTGGPPAAGGRGGLPPSGSRQGRPLPEGYYGRFGGGSISGAAGVGPGAPPSSWSQQSFTGVPASALPSIGGPSGPGRPPSVTGYRQSTGSGYPHTSQQQHHHHHHHGPGGGPRAPSVAGTSYSGAGPPGAGSSYYYGQGPYNLSNLRSAGPGAPSSVGGRSGGPRSEVGGFVTGGGAGGGALVSGVPPGVVAKAVTQPANPGAAAAATAAAPLRPEVDLALQSIQTSLAALHERLNRVESSSSSGRDAGLFAALFRAGSSPSASSGKGNNQNDGRQGSALRSAYAGFADAFHDIAVLLGFRRGRTHQGATPSFYQAGGSGGGNDRSRDALTLALRLGLAAVNLAVRLALDVTSVVILLSLLLTVVKRVTGRGDPLLLLRLIRKWTGLRPRVLIAATTGAAAAVAGGGSKSSSSGSGRAIGGAGGKGQ